jgi:hypothetical protein
MRCLHCDGKLPLYRKITHGQFCSGAHRKAYWQEQERLAVERLHQTHSSLKAYRPPPASSVESILGRDPGAAELSGFVPAVLYPQSHGAPRMVVADPLAYDLECLPGKLEWTIADRPARSVTSGDLIRPVREWTTQAIDKTAVAFPRGVELIPKCIPVAEARPSLHLSPLTWTEEAPVVAGPVQIALSANAVTVRTISPQPLASRMPRPAQQIGAYIHPVTPELEHRVVTQPPLVEDLLKLSRILEQATIQACQLVPPAKPSTLSASEPLAAPAFAVLPEQRLALAFGAPALAGAVPLFRGQESAVQAAPPAKAALENIRALDRASVPEALQVALALPRCQPSIAEPKPAMGRGSRYPIEFRLGSAHGPEANPMDFPSAPADVVLPTQLPQIALAPEVAQAASPDRADSLSLDAPAQQTQAPEPTVPDAVAEMQGLFSLKLKFGPPANQPVTPVVSNVATIPQPLRTEAIQPSSRLEPLDAKPAADFMQPEAGQAPAVPGTAVNAYLWSRAAGFWKLAPRDLKILAFAIPVLLALAAHRELPKVHVAATPPSTGNLRQNLQNVVNTQWTSVRQAVMDRAAVALDEDFRTGLDDWASRSDATAEWSFDSAGFVRPGPLALYRPSMNLTDYQVQFLGMIDKKALSWVVRAANFDNYYVMKLEVLKPGPRTTVGLTRYAVINGKAVDRVDTVVPMEAQPDTLYRVKLELDGNDFSLTIQGQMVDTWTEPRLPKGGIGFFTKPGEESRVRWVALTHQYDMLGRLCAYLAPYESPTTNGSW